MKALITDLDRAELARLGIDKGFGSIVGPEEVEPSRSCVGCFGCWTKTPGACVLKDGLQRLGETLARADELQIVPRCTYGGYSRTVKAIIDRCIPYVHPCFRMLGGEMHHRLRYDRMIRLRVCLPRGRGAHCMRARDSAPCLPAHGGEVLAVPMCAQRGGHRCKAYGWIGPPLRRTAERQRDGELQRNDGRHGERQRHGEWQQHGERHDTLFKGQPIGRGARGASLGRYRGQSDGRSA